MFHENETITGHFGFVFEENSVREIIGWEAEKDFMS